MKKCRFFKILEELQNYEGRDQKKYKMKLQKIVETCNTKKQKEREYKSKKKRNIKVKLEMGLENSK